MSKNLSAKHYQEVKERLQIKACEGYQNLHNEGEKRSNNMVMNVTKVSQKSKNISLLSIEKNILSNEKNALL